MEKKLDGTAAKPVPSKRAEVEKSARVVRSEGFASDGGWPGRFSVGGEMIDFSAISALHLRELPQPEELLKLCRSVVELAESEPLEYERHVRFYRYLFSSYQACGNLKWVRENLAKEWQADERCYCAECTHLYQECEKSYERFKSGGAIPQRNTAPGFIYLIRTGQYFKIGKSRTLAARLSQLSTLTPEPTELVHQFSSNDSRRAEQTLHKRYAEVRRNGEWFSLSAAQVLEITAIKEMVF